MLLLRNLGQLLLRFLQEWLQPPQRHLSLVPPPQPQFPPKESEPEVARLITRAEILNKHDVSNPLTPVMEGNLRRLLDAINKLRLAYGKPMVVSSGYRPPAHNAKIGGAPNSCHLVCAAVDFKDRDGDIKKFCLDNLSLLEECGLWMEDPSATPSWCHLQIQAPVSHRRVFKP